VDKNRRTREVKLDEGSGATTILQVRTAFFQSGQRNNPQAGVSNPA
jgi:hypothetical protein